MIRQQILSLVLMGGLLFSLLAAPLTAYAQLNGTPKELATILQDDAQSSVRVLAGGLKTFDSLSNKDSALNLQTLNRAYAIADNNGNAPRPVVLKEAYAQAAGVNPNSLIVANMSKKQNFTNDFVGDTQQARTLPASTLAQEQQANTVVIYNADE